MHVASLASVGIPMNPLVEKLYFFSHRGNGEAEVDEVSRWRKKSSLCRQRRQLTVVVVVTQWTDATDGQGKHSFDHLTVVAVKTGAQQAVYCVQHGYNINPRDVELNSSSVLFVSALIHRLIVIATNNHIQHQYRLAFALTNNYMASASCGHTPWCFSVTNWMPAKSKYGR